ncbi:cytidine/deoxycytidylate deaminase family protein [Brevibacillus laterosporus]|uniref:Cell division protein DedD n=2 Tax=Brevibacillus TaxID=55080 RepID=A0A0F6Y075_BRELA|nr:MULTISPECIES: cytidine/deoxycytidylate deaminase family protein [Brevibacillus]AKF95036.1 cell division protein DedD [Brevibacillus laterosporus]MCR8986327.1 cytidine/deoxycytidylate deaminase family protein [Brevibacillus laterosporus]MCZ0832061.1 cytidine/deoxycytidylate deaminase family protein [Brevibacillus halotolerans]OAJ73598.1 cell division protein DedD [Brevibacillus sp. SKDU10]GIO02244.1 deaminase [Brevibacillus halotolerans]
MARKSWDEYFLDIADQVSTRSTCPRLHVGSVIVKDKHIIATGYNGSIHGHDHCDDGGCLINEAGRCVRTVHAEVNSVLHADRDSLKGATAYVTHEPCENCAKTLAQSGIARIVYRNAYPNKWNEHFLKGIEVVHLPFSDARNN